MEREKYSEKERTYNVRDRVREGMEKKISE
jgi:hypothetical protein